MRRPLLPNLIISLLALSASTPTYLHAQRLGGTQSGSESPTEAKAPNLEPNVLSGDVDLFTGTYSASHSLGSVSTPAGLTFELALNYSPTIIGGATPLVHEGIPYGSGWSLNLPTISVKTAYWKRLSSTDVSNIQLQAGANEFDPLNPVTYDHIPGDEQAQVNGATDGYGVWYEPEISIPGVASGRLVFQKHTADGAVFVLNTFEEPIEALYSQGSWEVTVADGRVYYFGATMSAVQMPDNKRWLKYDRLTSMIALGYDDPHAALNRNSIRNAILPKAHVLTWYCARIVNSVHGPNQSIQFNYEGYGQWDMFKEYEQPFHVKIAEVFFNDSEDVTPFTNISIPSLPCTYQDVLLRSISAGSLLTTHERIVLEHDYAVPGPSMVTPGGGNDVPVHLDQCSYNGATGIPPNAEEDPLYMGEVVQRWGTVDGEIGEDFIDWEHCPHYAHDDVPKPSANGWSVNARDPYRNPQNGLYTRESVNGTAANGLAFDHGFLSSEPILANLVIPGDLWEVRTSFVANANVNFDINIGLELPEQPNVDRPLKPLFSTFDRMLKWNTYGTNGIVRTSNVFAMPYVPNGLGVFSNNGIRIQVGPANSDNNFNMAGSTLDLTDLQKAPGLPSAYRSYPHRRWELRNVTDPAGMPSFGLLSHDPIPQNFGIGLPWSAMLPVHRKYELAISYNENGIQTPDGDSHFGFWWSNGSNEMDWPNKPTPLSATSKLKGVELIRYGKRPWMLMHVKKYVRNGETTNDGGWQLYAQVNLAYERTDMQIPVPVQPTNYTGTVIYEPYQRSVYELTSIERMPLENASLLNNPNEQSISTRFLYADAEDYALPQAVVVCEDPEHPNDPAYERDVLAPQPLRAIVATGRLLYEVNHPMGQVMTLEYNDPLDADVSHYTSLDGRQMGITFGYDPEEDICDQNFSMVNATGAITPTVSAIIRTDAGTTERRTTAYTYEDPRRKVSGLLLNGNYTVNKPRGETKGFLHTTVLEPENETGQRVRRDYYFHGDLHQSYLVNIPPSCTTCVSIINSPPWPPPAQDNWDYLLWGRLKESVVMNPAGQYLERTTTEYEPKLAYLNGANRPGKGMILQTTHAFDYLDQMPDFDLEEGNYHGDPEFEQPNTWRMTPHFLEAIDELPAPGFVRPDIHMNSYFIERKNQKHTVFDPNGCNTYADPGGVEPPLEPGTRYNPDGSNGPNGHTTANAPDILAALTAVGLNTSTHNTLIAAGPLQESIIEKVLQVANAGSAELLLSVLRAQPRLTNDRLLGMLGKLAILDMKAGVSILRAQPILTDAILGEVLSKPELSSEDKAEVLASRTHLSSALLFSLLGPAQPLSAVHLQEVFLRQPPLTYGLQLAVAKDTLMPPLARARILSAQPHIPPAVFAVILNNRLHWPVDAIEELVLNGPTYPDEAFLSELLHNTSRMPSSVLINILGASPAPFSTALRTLIDGSLEIAAEDRNHLFSRIGTNLRPYCGAPCVAATVGITTVTEYSYYTAGPDGKTTSPGYRALLGLEDETLHPTIQLKWEPSWLLFSTRTYSPQYPGAYKEQREFYFQDLRNRYDRHWSALVQEDHAAVDLEPLPPPEGNFNVIAPAIAGPFTDPDGQTIVPKIEAVKLLTEFRDRTKQPFETQVWSKAAGISPPVITSTYYEFTGKWDWSLVPTYVTVEHGTPCTTGPPDGQGLLGDPDMPLSAALLMHPKLNLTNWSSFSSELPAGYRFVHNAQGKVGLMRNADWNEQSGLTTLQASTLPEASGGGPKMRPFRLMMTHAFLHKATHQQADEVLTEEYLTTRPYVENVPLLNFKPMPSPEDQDNEVMWQPIFPYRTISNERVLAYNWDCQPTRMKNDRELITEVEYTTPIQHIHYVDPCTSYLVEEYQHPARPSSTTIGVGSGAEQMTSYTYTDQGRLATVTDANGTERSFEYDGHGERVSEYRNGEMLKRIDYSLCNYLTPTYTDGFAQTQLNWTETRTRLFPENNAGICSRTYLDPNGRAYATLTGPVGDIHSTGSAAGPVVLAGRQQYDAWSRPVRAYGPTVAQGYTFALQASAQNVTGIPFQSTAYENDHRSRPIRAAAQGEHILTGHTRRTSYQSINSIALACELRLNPYEIGSLMPGDHQLYRWNRTEVEDEDGNISRTYTNALGQQVATASFPDGPLPAVTLFLYDERGNLSRVIDPKKQHTTYRYNILGWMIERRTVDGSRTKYMYDTSGNVVLEQDANGLEGEEDPNILVNDAPSVRTYYRRTVYDSFNRPVRQERVRQTHPADHAYTGTHIKSWPVPVLAYETRDMVVAWPQNMEDDEPWNVSAYTFSSASTIDRFARYHIMRRNDFNDGTGGYEIVPEWVGVSELLGTPLPEKEWVYDNAALAPDDPVEPTTLFMGTATDLGIWRQGMLGRLSHTVTYPHRLFSEVLTDTDPITNARIWPQRPVVPVHYDFHSYNADGFPAWQLQQFNANGITTESRGQLIRLDYPAYTLAGQLRTVNVDVNNDGQLDMQQAYSYDDLGRLGSVYLNLDDSGADGELIASYTYDAATGLPDKTYYHRKKCGEHISLVVETIDHTHDIRHRLTELASNHYAERLYYDGQLPMHPVAGTIDGGQHYNGAINALTHSYALQNMAGYEPGYLDLPTTYGFHYDGLGRMVTADAVVGDRVAGLQDAANSWFRLGDERYTFDKVGNIITAQRTGLYAPVQTPRSLHWYYKYQAGTNRLLRLDSHVSSALPGRQYTYDPAGNLLSDAARQMVATRYGRANLPYAVELYDGTYTTTMGHLYGPTDQRLYKQLVSDKNGVQTQEFHLYDAQGRVLGIADLRGGEPDGNGQPTGAWSWYAFGQQRFARYTPRADQQPTLYTSDLGNFNEANPEGARFEGLLEHLLEMDLQPDGIEYPCEVVQLKLPTGAFLTWSQAYYDEQVGLDPSWEQLDQFRYTFPTDKATVEIARNTGEQPMLVSVEELLGEGQAKSGAHGVPFAYTTFDDPRLRNVTFYVHDHLGNTRVTYTVGCDGSNGAGHLRTLEHAVDYFPYGSILREFVNSTGPEKYLTTHHERDQETGLDYRGARYYDSDVARFLSLDPLAADYASWSPYNYVMGNPISLVDPDGRSATKYEDENGKYLGDDGVDNGLTMQVTQAKWNEVNSDKRNLGSDGKLNSIGRARLSVDGKITDSPELRDLRAKQQSDPTNNIMKGGMLAIGALAADDVTGVGIANDVLIPFVVIATDALVIGTIIHEMASEHSKNARPSTKGKHEEGQARRMRDRGGEKADENRNPPRKRPDGWKGPYPPKKN
ncbi:MAG: RHS repeat-associated core domain-containing protein [Flavobacteriales bacterium]|nr:RHS repeat-associated core domain-containing protein [Flavobacteriales bacterium]